MLGTHIVSARCIMVAVALLCVRGTVDAETVRVGLFCSEPPHALRVVGPCILTAVSTTHQVLGGDVLTIKSVKNGILLKDSKLAKLFPSAWLKPSPVDATVTFITKHGKRCYRGKIFVHTAGGKLRVINNLELEDYLRSVLPSEMPANWPTQALAAQAVVARCFAVSQRGRHSAEGFDVCDSTHCQVYRGASWERANTNRAVAETTGCILTFGGKPVALPYHSTCGGRTAAGTKEDGYTEYLTSVADNSGTKDYCAGSNHFKWSCVLSSTDLKRVLEAAGLQVRGPISDVQIIERDASGRAVALQFKSSEINSLPGSRFMIAAGRELGWNKIKSTLFEIKKVYGKFVFSGRGLGHGMGLCQWGARGMAEKGFSYREILAHYYPLCKFMRHSAGNGNALRK